MRILEPALCVLCLPVWLAGAAGGAAQPVDLKGLPVNKWALLPARVEPGYMWSQMLYAPTRGQVLHWGRVGTSRADQRNDVRAFDAAAGDWVSDYLSDPGPELNKATEKGMGTWTTGSGVLLPSGKPAPSAVVNAFAWDTRRKQVVVTLKGLMAAYDPETRKWTDLKAKTVLDGKEYPGGPPVYGAGACYDPANDEIVMFPQWGGCNMDRVDVDGRVYAHYGTFIYGFKDDTWRRASETFGTDEVKAARKGVLRVMSRVSRASDIAWALRRRPSAASPADVDDHLSAASVLIGKLALPAPQELLASAGASIQEAAAKAKAAKWEEVVKGSTRALWALDELLDTPLRVEPPARAATPMVYDPKSKAIVMFGGHDGLCRTDLASLGRDPLPPGLNDTWLYDVKMRQWRDISKPNRPPATARHTSLVYDPASGLVLLVTRSGGYEKNKAITVWSLDVAKGEWSKRAEEPWTGKTGYFWSVGLDEKAGLLVMTQVDAWTYENNIKGQETWVLKLDVAKMPSSPAPAWTPHPPIQPHALPPDDPAWLARLKELPPNKWIHPKPPRDAETRDWGNAAADPVRGHLYYFGGGHSTYQVNDVAIYAPGANRWAHASGDHNDWVPLTHWDGIAMGLRGGEHAGHQRNTYIALDGRMYVSTGAESRRWGADAAKEERQRFCWFYDLDRGGIWRMLPVKLDKDPKAPGVYGCPHLAAPDGHVLGFGGALEPYDGRFFAGEVYFNSLDIYTGELTVKKLAPPLPGFVYEVRPFCYMPDRNQILYYEYVGSKGKTERQATWLYDLRTGAFTDLKPKRHPPGEPNTIEYIDGQDAAFAVINRTEQWVYSFKRNTWAPLPLDSDAKLGFAGPYTQLAYSARYGVLINTGHASGGVAVMRPDFSQLKWE
jgi:hypothetical protein